MTEEDAKTKWCPMIQVAATQHFNDVVFGDNRGNGDEDHNCIASECMWWVWDQVFTSMNLAKEGETPIMATGTEISDKEGHCGAAK